MREPCRVRHVERAEHGTVSRKPAVCRVMQVRVGQIRLSVAGVSVVLGGGWPTDRGSGRQGPGRASNMSVSPVAEVPQPAEAPTPAVPDAPVAPAVPDPGTPAAPEEPSTVPGPDERARRERLGRRRSDDRPRDLAGVVHVHEMTRVLDLDQLGPAYLAGKPPRRRDRDDAVGGAGDDRRRRGDLL